MLEFLGLAQTGFGAYNQTRALLGDATNALLRRLGTVFLASAAEHVRQAADYDGDPAREFELAAADCMNAYQFYRDSVPKGFWAGVRGWLPGTQIHDARKASKSHLGAAQAAVLAALAYQAARQPALARRQLVKAREALDDHADQELAVFIFSASDQFPTTQTQRDAFRARFHPQRRQIDTLITALDAPSP